MEMKLKNYFKESYKNKPRKLGKPEPYDPNNPDHDDPNKYVFYPSKGVFTHTIEALKHVKADQPLAVLATLLHDVGKGVTLSHEKGLPIYLGHAQKSVELVNSIADRLRMSKKEKDSLLMAVGNHMKFHKILDMKASKIAKLVSDKNWDVLVSVAKADEYARGYMFRHAGEFEKIVDKAVEVKEKFGSKQVNKQIKLVDGKDVMKLTGGKPGPKIGATITKVTTWIMDNSIEDKQEIEKKIKEVYNSL
jgi:tRNA nucleotidyltransferase (CCA-adding enzyme)